MSKSLEDGRQAVAVRRDPVAANAHAASVTLASAAPRMGIFKLNRRSFLVKTALGTAAALIAGQGSGVLGANDAVRIRVVGLHGRGQSHIYQATRIPGFRLAALCDVDPAVLGQNVEKAKAGGHPVRGFKDVRDLIASKEVDAVTIATPNHWHARATIWACQAVSLLDTDHIWGVGGSHGWVWRSFLRGHNPIFMDPYDGSILGESRGEGVPPLRREAILASPGRAETRTSTEVQGQDALATEDKAKMASPQFELLRRNLGYTLRYASKVNLAAMTPQGELTSTGFCLAESGKEYLVYLPEGGEVTVDLSAASGSVAVEWLNPRSGDATQGQITSGGRKRSFKPPFDGDAVLYLRRQI